MTDLYNIGYMVCPIQVYVFYLLLWITVFDNKIWMEKYCKWYGYVTIIVPNEEALFIGWLNV